MNKGILSGICAYLLWGLFPIYWKILHLVPAVQIIGHRIVWSFIFLIIIVISAKQWNNFRSAVNSKKVLVIYLAASALLTVNWFVYVWGVNSGRIVETSLGYFINPLFSVLLGIIFLKEKLRLMQWIPVILAAAGVIYLTFDYGRVPWIALSLAFTFGLYGLVKKIAPLDSLFGLTFETAIAFPLALTYLIFVTAHGTGSFPQGNIANDLLLIATGIITSVPLLLFAYAARNIPLSTVGILQYIAPSLQFLIGVAVYREEFGKSDMIGFGLVWTALLIFSIESTRNRSRIKAELKT
ncbi:MAG TPA: EamA family transporter RarD [Clostridiales bacterium]|nr:EamA family transporter RarD [Clostridiales bacterium]HQP68997.1 EamA family transporter RarD [Clostridiales bacterium]